MMPELLDIERELAAEDHRNGLEVGLTYGHCVLCQREYVRRHCPHEDTVTIESLSDPRPHVYCSTCGEPMPPPW